MSIDDEQLLDSADSHLIFDCLRRAAVCYQRWIESGSNAQLGYADSWVNFAMWCCFTETELGIGVLECVRACEAVVKRAVKATL